MNKISPSAKRLFLKSRGIKNSEQLIELLKSYYYTHRNNRPELLKDYDTEQLSVFLWMHDKYVKGKFGKLKELFVSPVAAETEKSLGTSVWRLPDGIAEYIKLGKERIEEHEKEIISNLELKKEDIEKAIKDRGTTVPYYVMFPESMHIIDIKTPEGNIQENKIINTFNSTRHKANPETTNYTQKTSEGYRRTYEVEQPKFTQSQTSIPDFNSQAQLVKDAMLSEAKDIQTVVNILGSDVGVTTDLKNESGYSLKFRMEPCLSGDLQKAGKKETEGKLPLELDFDFVKQMAERMNSNKNNGKYSLFNWKSEMDIRLLSEAVMRHCIEVIEGRYEDDGRSYGHLEALATGAMMINWQLKEKQRKADEFFSSDLVDKK